MKATRVADFRIWHNIPNSPPEMACLCHMNWIRKMKFSRLAFLVFILWALGTPLQAAESRRSSFRLTLLMVAPHIPGRIKWRTPFTLRLENKHPDGGGEHEEGCHSDGNQAQA